MARVFKATYTKLRTVKDTKGNVLYDVRDGKKAPRRVPVLNRDGKPVLAESRKWYVEYKDANGRVRRKAGYTDRKATEQLAAELERTAEHVRSGYRPKEHEHLARPLSEHLADWREALKAKGTSDRQVQQVHNRAKRIVDTCGFVVWGDVQAAKVQKALAEMRKDTEEKRGISAQTSNWYLQAAKAFCEWLVMENRAPENPLAYLEGLNVRTDRRHDRRALTPDECVRLLATTAKGPTRWKMTGPERAMLYRVALESGLRAGEARTLTVCACRLEDDPPVLVVRAAYSKHRREDSQPIPPGLAEALKGLVAGRAADDRVFPNMPVRQHTAKMLRADLEDAGIPYRDDAGLVADYHALRHTFISNLARGGVHPKVAMDLARHGDVNLTMARYSHTVVADRAEALAALPCLSPDGPDAVRGKATGTYDGRPETGQSTGPDAKQNSKRGQRDAPTPSNAVDRPSGRRFAKPVYVSKRTAGSTPKAPPQENPALSVRMNDALACVGDQVIGSTLALRAGRSRGHGACPASHGAAAYRRGAVSPGDGASFDEAFRECGVCFGEAFRECRVCFGEALRECRVCSGEAFRECGVCLGETLRECGVCFGETLRECGIRLICGRTARRRHPPSLKLPPSPKLGRTGRWTGSRRSVRRAGVSPWTGWVSCMRTATSERHRG